MGIGDGTVHGTTLIINNGSPTQRWNLVIVGDGYQAAELGTFETDAQDVVNALFAAPPFNDPGGILVPGIQSAINVHRINVSSTDSGADDPTACGGSGATAATYFDASFCNGGIRRLLQVNNTTVLDVVNAEVPQWHSILCLVNSTVYGGGGGTVATSSKAAGALEVALHELGHSAFGLADEYEYWAGCGVDTGRNNHSASEPSEPNVTTTLAPLKWAGMTTPGIAIPTTTNADCTLCDPQGNPVGAADVGAFEGAHYYHCDAYRPQFDCKMRALGFDWCAVCRQKIRQVLRPFRPRPPIWEIFERLEVVLGRIRFENDWVVDPAPFDLGRFERLTHVRRLADHTHVEDDLSRLLESAETMTVDELRANLAQIRGQIARLEAAAKVTEASLQHKQ